MICIGALTLDLNRLYKPAKDSESCTVDIVDDRLAKDVSIFEIKRLKGWWPCVDLQDGKPKLTVSLFVNMNRTLSELFRVKSNWN